MTNRYAPPVAVVRDIADPATLAVPPTAARGWAPCDPRQHHLRGDGLPASRCSPSWSAPRASVTEAATACNAMLRRRRSGGGSAVSPSGAGSRSNKSSATANRSPRSSSASRSCAPMARPPRSDGSVWLRNVVNGLISIVPLLRIDRRALHLRRIAAVSARQACRHHRRQSLRAPLRLTDVLDTVVSAETPEGILLELRPAGLSARFYAFGLDWVIRLAIMYAARHRRGVHRRHRRRVRAHSVLCARMVLSGRVRADAHRAPRLESGSSDSRS